ncbi:MAG: hypothetical protein RL885_33115 [Planctomycetota bacterium]
MTAPREIFHWPDTTAKLTELRREHALVEIERPGRYEIHRLTDGTVAGECHLPLVLSPFEPRDTLEPGLHWIVLLQAGAASLGVWQPTGLTRHKVIKKYVVRGKGRAQTLHLKTKGKSRYGSRLRLQNAEALLVETNEKLLSWADELGEARAIFKSCPVRMWPDLFAVEPLPPFEQRDERLVKIPRDVKVPNHEELERVVRFLERGAIEWR